MDCVWIAGGLIGQDLAREVKTRVLNVEVDGTYIRQLAALGGAPGLAADLRSTKQHIDTPVVDNADVVKQMFQTATSVEKRDFAPALKQGRLGRRKRRRESKRITSLIRRPSELGQRVEVGLNLHHRSYRVPPSGRALPDGTPRCGCPYVNRGGLPLPIKLGRGQPLLERLLHHTNPASWAWSYVRRWLLSPA